MGIKLQDGRWGRFTQHAYETADAITRSRVDSLLLHAGSSAANEFNARRRVKAFARSSLAALDAPQQAVLVKQDDAARMVAAAAARMGVSQYATDLVDFLRREAKQVRGQDGISFDAMSKNGSSRGLMQMQPNAWIDAAKRAPEIGPYANVYDPWKNTLAGVAYAAFNIGILRRLRPDLKIDGEVLYLAHNQGAGFFTKTKGSNVTNVAGQSKEVQAIIRKHSR